MSDDISVENYKKSVTKYLNLWEAEAKAVGRELATLEAELGKLDAVKAPAPADTKRISELQKKREALSARMNRASDELRLNLLLIEAPPGAPEKELVKLPAWLKELVKRKGVPLGKNVTITPKVEFNLKARKLKSFEVTLEWKF